MSAETAEASISSQEVILAYLQKERETWLGARAVAERAGWENAEANLAERKSYKMLDALLIEYHGEISGGA